jgi:hypothetical protein
MGRDAASGHAMMFSVFTTILDTAEQHLLLEQLWPPFPLELLAYLRTTHRTVYYLDNVSVGDRVRVSLRARFATCPPPMRDAVPGATSVARLEHSAEAYSAISGALLAAARTTKALVVPRQLATLAQHAERLIQQNGGST